MKYLIFFISILFLFTSNMYSLTTDNITSEIDEFENNSFNLANNIVDTTLDDVSVNINRNNNRNWTVGSTISNLANSLASVVNTGITTTGSVANTGITTTGSVINTAITTTPQVLNAVMPLLTASQEQLHKLEDAIGEDINYLINTSLLKISRDAISARFKVLVEGGVKSIPQALIGDVTGVVNGNMNLNLPDVSMPTNINQPAHLEDYDLIAMLAMDANKDGKITIGEMRQAVKQDRKNLPIIQRIFNVLSRRDMAQARQDTRDYNKNNPIKNGQPTVFANGVPSNLNGKNNMPIQAFNQPQPGVTGQSAVKTRPGIFSGLGSNRRTNPAKQSAPSNTDQQFDTSGLGGMPISTSNQPITNAQQFSGAPALPPLGSLSDEQREQIEDQLKDSGYDVDYDNPATLDFNHDGKIDDDEKDLAVKLDRAGMNTIARMLDEITRQSNREAGQAANAYNSGNSNQKNSILGKNRGNGRDRNGIFNRKNSGTGGTQPQPVITQPISPQYSGTANQPGAINYSVQPGYTPTPITGVGTVQQPVNPTQPVATPPNTNNGGDKNGIFNRNKNNGRDRNGIFNRNKDKGAEPYTGQLKPPYVCVYGNSDMFAHEMQSPQNIPVVNTPNECLALGFNSGSDYAVSLEDFNKALQSKDGQKAVLELIYGDVNGERGLNRIIPGDRDNKKKATPPVVIQLTGTTQQPTYPGQGGQINNGGQIPPTPIVTTPINQDTGNGQTYQGTGVNGFGNAVSDLRNQIFDTLSGGLIGSGVNTNTPGLNPLPGGVSDTTSQRGQVSSTELVDYANNMLELEKLAMAMEKGVSGIYARSDAEEMNILKSIENTILIYQRMIEMGVGAFQDDGYYYYQISNTGVKNKDTNSFRRQNIVGNYIPGMINQINAGNLNLTRLYLSNIRCQEGLPQNNGNCGNGIYKEHQWTTTKAPMDSAQRQLNQLLRQVNPYLKSYVNGSVSGSDSNTGNTNTRTEVRSNINSGKATVVSPEQVSTFRHDLFKLQVNNPNGTLRNSDVCKELWADNPSYSLTGPCQEWPQSNNKQCTTPQGQTGVCKWAVAVYNPGKGDPLSTYCSWSYCEPNPHNAPANVNRTQIDPINISR